MDTLEAHLAAHWTDVHPVVLAAWSHHALTQVHPFMDGNGRAARLLQDHVLWAHRYAPAIIRADELASYYGDLDLADAGDPNPLVRTVAMATASTMHKLTDFYRRERKRALRFSRLARRVSEVGRAREEAAYEKWRGAMERLRESFLAAAEAVSEAEGPVAVRARAYPTVTYDTWRSLRQEGRSSPNWFFILRFDDGAKSPSYIFSFGRGWQDAGESETAGEASAVLLQVARRERPSSPLEATYKDPHVRYPSLRSAWFDNEALCARQVVAEGTMAVERAVDSDALAEAFMVDVLRHEFGLLV